MNIKNNKLPAAFFQRDVLIVARELLGQTFVSRSNGKILSGLIVEVEAYDGSIDEAAHSFRGKTPRNEVMFEAGGLLYVYFTYGVHFCANIVTGNCGEGKAVLLRGIEPINGIKQMMINRFGRTSVSDKESKNLTNGPGKICQAFGINKEHNGIDLSGGRFFVLKNTNIEKNKVGISKRIGITKSVDLPWRFFIKNNLYVSHK